MLKLRVVAVTVVSACAMALMAGCGGGVKVEDLNAIDTQVQGLIEKGLPDDSTAAVRRFVVAAKLNLEKRENAQARANLDSARRHMERVQNFYDNAVATLGPVIDAAKAQVLKTKEDSDLTGFQARAIDSTLKVVDALRASDSLLKANAVVQALVERLPTLIQDEANARRLARELPGIWEFDFTMKSPEIPEINARERKIFTFGGARNPTVRLEESKKGQSGPMNREDYLFLSTGTYGLKGDTIMLDINRFSIVRQSNSAAVVDPNSGRIVEWRTTQHPTHDWIDITDGSQNRSITERALKEDFEKKGARRR